MFVFLATMNALEFLPPMNALFPLSADALRAASPGRPRAAAPTAAAAPLDGDELIDFAGRSPAASSARLDKT